MEGNDSTGPPPAERSDRHTCHVCGDPASVHIAILRWGMPGKVPIKHEEYFVCSKHHSWIADAAFASENTQKVCSRKIHRPNTDN